MLGLNNVQIIGNLGGTPDAKFLNDGKSQVVNFSVAVNERWKNRDGEPQERTTWLRVAAFNGIGQACAEHLASGDGLSSAPDKPSYAQQRFMRSKTVIVAPTVAFRQISF